MYQKAIRQRTDGHDFMIGWDDAKRHDTRSNLLHKVFFENGFEQNIANFFRTLVVNRTPRIRSSTRRVREGLLTLFAT
jgi:hypothetical protein